MEKGFFGQYSGNARHSRTPVTKKNYRASVADDAAHIHYLKEDINYDAKHGHSDKNMTADEKHISKLAGDIKYDKKHHSPLNENHPPFDPKVGEQQLDEVVVTLPEYHKKNLDMFDPGMPKLKKGISGRYQFQSESGGVDPFPSKAFTKGLGTQSAPGAPGASFTEEEVQEIKDRYKSYIKPKTDAEAFFASRS